MKRYIMLWLVCATITGVQILYAGQENERERTAFNEGYSMVLNKQWQTAVEHLQTFINNYPESRYTDDAAYWQAYALKHIDREKSAEAYRSFIEQHPGSKYIDDAVADLSTLEQTRHTQSFDPHTIDRQILTLQSLMHKIDSSIHRAERARWQAERIEHRAHNMRFRMENLTRQKKIEGQNQLKIESIHALTRISPDEETFEMLRRIILNEEEQKEVRLSALYSLPRFNEFQVSPLLYTLIEDETDEEIRMFGIQQLAQNKDAHTARSLELLKNIAFDTTAKRNIREMAFYALSQFKHHNMTAVLEEMLEREDDINLQHFAIYHLGKMEGTNSDKHFNLLQTILLNQTLNKQLRLAALHALTKLEHPGTGEMLINLFNTEDDEDMRMNLLHHLQRGDHIDKYQYADLIKKLALDTEETRNVRLTSLNALLRLDDDEKINTLLRIAKHDRDKEMRHFAIIALTRMDKSLSFQTLTDLMDIPEMQNPATFGVLLHSIASIGAGESVDILAHVARTHENYEIRRYAIRMLGNIGGEKARGVLYEILTQ